METDAKELGKLKKNPQYPLLEGRRILRKKLTKLSDEQAATLEKRVSTLAAALEKDQQEPLAAALTSVDEYLHGELAAFYKSPARDWFESLFIALAVALTLRFFVIEAFRIPSGSMYPTLWVGDHIFVNKLVYGAVLPFTNTNLARWGSPTRGEVIVFVYPLNRDEDYIKRVIGLPGDTVKIAGRNVWVNGQKISCELGGDYRYTDINSLDHNASRYTCTLESNHFEVIYEYTPETGYFNSEELTVPPGQYFVMGDNRDHSSDSRVWGFVPEENIKGKALFIWLSWSKIHGLSLGRFGQGID